MKPTISSYSAVVVVASLTAAWALAADLSTYQWKNRLMLIFAPSAQHTQYRALHLGLQMELKEVIDRDLILFRIFESGPSTAGSSALAAADAQSLRRRYAIQPGRLSVVLIGKDGGVKLVQHHKVNLNAIFKRIDGMPMRQEEMRQKEASSQ